MAFDFGLDRLRGSFFDVDAIVKEVNTYERKALARFGAFARRRMKSSLKYRDGKSAPGSPPNVHRSSGYTTAKQKGGKQSRQAASPLRELIFFALDPATHSVVVGPVKFGSRGGIAPALLEGGGSGTFRDAETGEVKRGVWAPRPFVRPAGEAEARAKKFLVG
jgi:hypothetical protein